MNRPFDRNSVCPRPLAERRNKIDFAHDRIAPETCELQLTGSARETVRQVAREIRAARACGASVVMAFGAHAIKNGLAPVLIGLMRGGWITHFATNGAAVIHDWEFAFQGCSGEDVRRYVAEGQFGLWQETGLYLNLALAVGAYEGRGYGESVGAFVANDGLKIPFPCDLDAAIAAGAASDADDETLARAAAAADLTAITRHIPVSPGFLQVPHPFKEYGLQAAA